MDRTFKTERITKETEIKAEILLDAGDRSGFSGATGIGFFDHMLNAMCAHGGMRIEMNVKGDIHVDGHHTVEDTGIVIGRLIAGALGDKTGIERFASEYVPMDESLAFCAADISGRACLVFDADFKQASAGAYETILTREFFNALASNIPAALHIRLCYGINAHHATEAVFKAVGRVFKKAFAPSAGVTSTKGTLNA